MKLNYIAALLTLLLIASCSENQEPQPGVGEEEYTYSFTAILDGAKTRLSYEEDEKTHDLKMVWEEGDVIRLYPDAEMGEVSGTHYDFYANTGAGTSHTVFVHQGYITGWENWKGKAIYVFPNKDNLKVPDNDENFFAKSQVQIANGNKEHLKYAEHKLDEDGNKQYTPYWSNIINGANLKHDTKLHFAHTTTQVYKLMLRGFIYDIPGGSLLKVSGASWPEGEISLQLGKPEDKEPFLEVGEYYTDNWKKDALLTAYIIRQIPAGTENAAIKKDEKLKIELLAYDPHDGEVKLLNPLDKEEHRQKIVDGKNQYFTNIPWAEEYMWDVTATEDRVYKAGDYVVADLSQSKTNTYSVKIVNQYHTGEYKIVSITIDESLPRVAVDLGLPVKWATYNVGASKVSDKGLFYLFGYTFVCDNPITGTDQPDKREDWTAGDLKCDAATANWGKDWRMPTFQDGIDLIQYTEVLNGMDDLYTEPSIFWDTKQWGEGEKRKSSPDQNSLRTIDGVTVIRVKSVFRPEKSIYFPATGKYISSTFQETKVLNGKKTVYLLMAPYVNTLNSITHQLLTFSYKEAGTMNLTTNGNEELTSVSFAIRAVRNR